jgi:hypothetical protein
MTARTLGNKVHWDIRVSTDGVKIYGAARCRPAHRPIIYTRGGVDNLKLLLRPAVGIKVVTASSFGLEVYTDIAIRPGGADRAAPVADPFNMK